MEDTSIDIEKSRISLSFDLMLDETEQYYTYQDYFLSKEKISSDILEILAINPMFSCEAFNLRGIISKSENSEELLDSICYSLEGVLQDIWEKIKEFFNWLFGTSEDAESDSEKLERRVSEIENLISKASVKIQGKMTAWIKKQKIGTKIINLDKVDFKSDMDKFAGILPKINKNMSSEDLSNCNNELNEIVKSIKEKTNSKDGKVPLKSLDTLEKSKKYFGLVKKQGLEKLDSKVVKACIASLGDVKSGTEAKKSKRKRNKKPDQGSGPQGDQKIALSIIKNIKFIQMFKLRMVNTKRVVAKLHIKAYNAVSDSDKSDDISIDKASTAI